MGKTASTSPGTGYPRKGCSSLQPEDDSEMSGGTLRTTGGHLALPSWQGRAILLVDLDAFFASVEQLDHPEWRGRPVIVGGDPDHRGVVSTCSYEARAFGVHSAQPASTARRLCPDAIWTRGDFRRYAEMSDAVMDILLDESPLLQQVSIDEAFLDVTPGRYLGEHPVAIATRIQERVAALGVTCSVGVATSKTVAKVASDMDKPRGLTVVYPGSEAAFLAPLPVNRLSGIGRRTTERLVAAGVTTLGGVARADGALLTELFGVNAERMRRLCQGIDDEPVVTLRDVKSVSNEMTFSTSITELSELAQAIEMQGAKVGRRLRRKGLKGTVVTLKLRYDDLSIRTAQAPLPHPTDNEHDFVPVARSLAGRIFEPGLSVRLVGVGISSFREGSEQMDLMDGDAGRSPRDRLAEATDLVRDRFGEDAVAFGRDLRFRDRGTGTAPQRKEEST